MQPRDLQRGIVVVVVSTLVDSVAVVMSDAVEVSVVVVVVLVTIDVSSLAVLSASRLNSPPKGFMATLL